MEPLEAGHGNSSEGVEDKRVSKEGIPVQSDQSREGGFASEEEIISKYQEHVKGSFIEEKIRLELPRIQEKPRPIERKSIGVGHGNSREGDEAGGVSKVRKLVWSDLRSEEIVIT